MQCFVSFLSHPDLARHHLADCVDLQHNLRGAQQYLVCQHCVVGMRANEEQTGIWKSICCAGVDIDDVWFVKTASNQRASHQQQAWNVEVSHRSLSPRGAQAADLRRPWSCRTAATMQGFVQPQHWQLAREASPASCQVASGDCCQPVLPLL
jgi:hypothetical protein